MHFYNIEQMPYRLEKEGGECIDMIMEAVLKLKGCPRGRCRQFQVR